MQFLVTRWNKKLHFIQILILLLNIQKVFPVQFSVENNPKYC